MIVDKIKDNYPLGNLAQNLAFSLQMKGTSSDMAYTQYHGEIQALQWYHDDSDSNKHSKITKLRGNLRCRQFAISLDSSLIG